MICVKGILIAQIVFNGYLGIQTPTQPKNVTMAPIAPASDTSADEPPSISPETALNEKIEAWATAIGKHESWNFRKCPYGCENSHNYWGRKLRSGAYAKWETEEEAWQNQKDYLRDRIVNRGCNTLELLRTKCKYAEDPAWVAGVSSHL